MPDLVSSGGARRFGDGQCAVKMGWGIPESVYLRDSSPVAVNLNGYEKRTADAVAHYWHTLQQQSKKQSTGDTDRERRTAVTGGKQMDGFCELLEWFLIQNGLSDASIYARSNLEIPGYFRPTKSWDLLVVHDGHLVAGCEFKSQRGPSFGNNFNNRTEEALGNAVDVWTAYREGAFGVSRPAPWLGWLMLLEDCERSASPVRVAEPHFMVSENFRDTSYADRYGILLQRLVLEKQYNAAAYLLATEEGGASGKYSEPVEGLGMKPFLASLGGHVAAYLASI